MANKSKRCAIYTHKSSEEGLDQSFNSLNAQREACEAYVPSQTSEGWEASPDYYDDGGFSGGNTDRPGLQKLLAEIAAGEVDIVVVNKIDRLTRSLADFARILEVFEKHECSFVSVTQSFNTTGSMGKLMLNVPLSFAQFEREVRPSLPKTSIRGAQTRKMRINAMERKTLAASPRCFAKTGKGAACQSPAVKGRKRCRMHGGTNPGAPKGNQNARKHGGYSAEP